MEEIENSLLEGNFDYFKAEYYDSKGNRINDSLRTRLNGGELLREFYVDRHGIVTQIRVKPIISDEDIFYEIRLRALLSRPFKDVSFKEVDCSDMSNDLAHKSGLDQEVRNGEINSRELSNVDGNNKDIAISYVYHCGWSHLDTSLINPVFYIFQHMPGDLLAYYYPSFKEFAHNGWLEQSLLSKMEDRLLMFNGFDQIYGTQIVQQSFYKIRDPLNVNELRKARGLPPIEESALRHNIDYNPLNHIRK